MERGSRTIRVAAVQMPSRNGMISANLELATQFVEQATDDGAQVVLLPEFASAGYSWVSDLWDAGESRSGPTVEWLRQTSSRLGIYLGTSYLEAEGEDFFNTFVLTTPEGREAGRVRKQTPALRETFFCKGEVGPHVIETAIGRIGIGICFENQLAFLPRLMQQHAVDMMLMPHSAPSLLDAYPVLRSIVPDATNMLRDVAREYAVWLGIPVVMANKCGPWDSGRWIAHPADFLGLSTIVDSDGAIMSHAGVQPRAIVADVVLAPQRKVNAVPARQGRWAVPVPWTMRTAFWLPEQLGKVAYRLSSERREKARAISAGACRLD